MKLNSNGAVIEPQLIEFNTLTRCRGVACGLSHSIISADVSDVQSDVPPSGCVTTISERNNVSDVWGSVLFVFGSNENGQLGIGNDAIYGQDPNIYSPLQLTISARNNQKCLSGRPATGTISFAHISCGGGHTVIVSVEGDVYSTGLNSSGQLGLGDIDNRNIFHQVACIGEDGSVDVSESKHGDGDVGRKLKFGYVCCGEEYTFAISRGLPTTSVLEAGSKVAPWDARRVYAWGLNNAGQLGNNLNAHDNAGLNFRNSLVPIAVKQMDGHVAERLVCSQSQVMCIVESGEVYTWGLPSRANHAIRTAAAISNEIDREKLFNDMIFQHCIVKAEKMDVWGGGSSRARLRLASTKGEKLGQFRIRSITCGRKHFLLLAKVPYGPNCRVSDVQIPNLNALSTEIASICTSNNTAATNIRILGNAVIPLTPYHPTSANIDDKDLNNTVLSFKISTYDIDGDACTAGGCSFQMVLVEVNLNHDGSKNSSCLEADLIRTIDHGDGTYSCHVPRRVFLHATNGSLYDLSIRLQGHDLYQSPFQLCTSVGSRIPEMPSTETSVKCGDLVEQKLDIALELKCEAKANNILAEGLVDEVCSIYNGKTTICISKPQLNNSASTSNPIHSSMLCFDEMMLIQGENLVGETHGHSWNTKDAHLGAFKLIASDAPLLFHIEMSFGDALLEVYEQHKEFFDNELRANDSDRHESKYATELISKQALDTLREKCAGKILKLYQLCVNIEKLHSSYDTNNDVNSGTSRDPMKDCLRMKLFPSISKSIECGIEFNGELQGVGYCSGEYVVSFLLGYASNCCSGTCYGGNYTFVTKPSGIDISKSLVIAGICAESNSSSSFAGVGSACTYTSLADLENEKWKTTKLRAGEDWGLVLSLADRHGNRVTDRSAILNEVKATLKPMDLNLPADQSSLNNPSPSVSARAMIRLSGNNGMYDPTAEEMGRLVCIEDTDAQYSSQICEYFFHSTEFKDSSALYIFNSTVATPRAAVQIKLQSEEHGGYTAPTTAANSIGAKPSDLHSSYVAILHSLKISPIFTEVLKANQIFDKGWDISMECEESRVDTLTPDSRIISLQLRDIYGNIFSDEVGLDMHMVECTYTVGLRATKCSGTSAGDDTDMDKPALEVDDRKSLTISLNRRTDKNWQHPSSDNGNNPIRGHIFNGVVCYEWVLPSSIEQYTCFLSKYVTPSDLEHWLRALQNRDEALEGICTATLSITTHQRPVQSKVDCDGCMKGAEILYSPWKVRASILQRSCENARQNQSEVDVETRKTIEVAERSLVDAVSQLVTHRKEDIDAIQKDINNCSILPRLYSSVGTLESSNQLKNKTIRESNYHLKNVCKKEDQQKLLALTINRSEMTRRRAAAALKKEQMRLEQERQAARKKKQVKRVGGGFSVQFSKDI